MKTIGSQRREPLKDTDYELVGKLVRTAILRPKDGNGPDEIWMANDSHSGYTIQIGRWGYEFVRSVPDLRYHHDGWVNARFFKA